MSYVVYGGILLGIIIISAILHKPKVKPPSKEKVETDAYLKEISKGLGIPEYQAWRLIHEDRIEKK